MFNLEWKKQTEISIKYTTKNQNTKETLKYSKKKSIIKQLKKTKQNWMLFGKIKNLKT